MKKNELTNNILKWAYFENRFTNTYLSILQKTTIWHSNLYALLMNYGKEENLL